MKEKDLCQTCKHADWDYDEYFGGYKEWMIVGCKKDGTCKDCVKCKDRHKVNDKGDTIECCRYRRREDA